MLGPAQGPLPRKGAAQGPTRVDKLVDPGARDLCAASLSADPWRKALTYKGGGFGSPGFLKYTPPSRIRGKRSRSLAPRNHALDVMLGPARGPLSADPWRKALTYKGGGSEDPRFLKYTPPLRIRGKRTLRNHALGTARDLAPTPFPRKGTLRLVPGSSPHSL